MKILVIDDEKTIRKALIFALRKEGHQITEAETASEAEQVLISFDFDLIIIDWNIPFFSGIEFIRKLRGMAIRIPVIILSSMRLKEHIDEHDKLGPVFTVSKDMPLAKILEFIEQRLEIETGTDK